jgi:hypothetical protein
MDIWRLFIERPRVYVPLLCGGAGILSIALGPDNNWDLLYYHLYAPYAYLHGRYLYDFAPAEAQSFLNPTADLLFYALTSSILNETPRVIAFIMGAVHGINAVLILAIAFHVLRPLNLRERSALRTAALLMSVSGVGFISLLGTTTDDLLNSIFVLGSLLCILRVSERAGERGTWRGYAWSGFLAGIGFGLKYTSAIYIPGLSLVALIAAIRHKFAGGPVVFGVAAMSGFLAVAGDHLLTLWQAFGNPVFPFLNHIFQSPYYEAVSIRDVRFLPRDLWQLIAYPFYWAKTNSYLVSEVPFRDWRGAITYIAIAAGVLSLAANQTWQVCRRNGVFVETRGLGLVISFVVVSYFVWALGFGIYRYALVLEMLSGIVTMGALIWLFEDRRLRIAVAIALLTTTATTIVYFDWGRGQFGDKYIDVRVPQLPANSVVLMATREPVAYFIPFAEPTVQFIGIENDFLELTQSNKLVSEVKRVMQTPGRLKFIVNVGEFSSDEMKVLLEQFGLRLSTSPCQPIRSNLEEQPLSLCPVETSDSNRISDGV